MAREPVGKGMDEEATCICPFCENVLEMPAPWCTRCGAEISFCVECEEPLPQDATVCPSCGAACEG